MAGRAAEGPYRPEEAAGEQIRKRRRFYRKKGISEQSAREQEIRAYQAGWRDMTRLLDHDIAEDADMDLEDQVNLIVDAAAAAALAVDARLDRAEAAGRKIDEQLAAAGQSQEAVRAWLTSRR